MKKYSVIFRFLLNTMILISLLIFSGFAISNFIYLDNWARIISILSLILLLYHLITFYFLRYSYTDFRIWFIILINLFMFGRVYLIGFNHGDNIFWDLLSRYPDELLYTSSLFVLCSLQGLFTGITLSNRKSINKGNNFLNKFNNNELSYAVYLTGLIMVVFSFPFQFLTDITKVQQAQSSSSYLSVSTQSGVVDDFAILFIPGALFIISSKFFKKKTILLIITLIISYLLIIMILTGDRRSQVIAILSIAFCFVRTYNIKISFLKMILYALVGGLLLNILSVIRNIRTSNLTDISGFIQEYGDLIVSNNPFYETLSEFGLTLISLVGVIENIPTNVPFQYGFGFYGAIPSVLPIGWIFGDFFKSVSISRTINEIEGYPVGGSLLGDLYANFGWVSIAIIIIVGYFITKLFSIPNTNTAYYQARHFALFFILINLARSSFYEIFRPTVMVFLIPILIMFILYNLHLRKSSNKII